MVTRYNPNSIVDTLAKAGQPNDYASRAKLAGSLGITNYQGTANQNTDLIKRYTNNASVTTPTVVPTPTAVVTPTPTTTPTVTPSVSRYTNPLNQYKDYYSNLKTNFTSGDENAIREAERARVQEQLNSVEAMANSQRNDQIVENKQNSGRTRSILSASGLGGSGRGLAKTTETEKYNQKQLQDIENAKQAKIAELLAGVDDRASKAIEAARQEAKGNFEAKLKFDKENVDAAKNAAIEFAKLGVTQDKLDPKDIEDIMSQTGMSKLELDALWNGNLPDSMKTQYQDVTTQGANGNATLTRVGHNPQTGEVTKQVYDLGVPYTDVAKGDVQKYGKDGLMIVYPNGTHKVLVGSSDGSNASAVNSNLNEFPADIQAAAQSILDGKTKLNEYPSAKRLQINQAMSKVYNAEGGNELAQGAYDSIISLEKHPGFKSAIGAKGLSSFFGLKGKPVGGSDAAGFDKELEKLKANIKLVNIKYLKGTGALSDSEGKTLEDAGTSLDTSLPEKDFKTELERVKKALLKANNVTKESNSDQYANERNQLQQGEILVQDKNGNVGAIPANEFDASLYTKI